jgi:predicted nucleic-acid-binding Zn-ribbon protein
MKKECNHSKRRTYWTKEEHFITGEMEDKLVDEWESTFIDIDLHRCKCIQCGKTEYYSLNYEHHRI